MKIRYNKNITTTISDTITDTVIENENEIVNEISTLQGLLRDFLEYLLKMEIQGKKYPFRSIEKETDLFELFKTKGNPLEILKTYETWANETKKPIKNICSSLRNCAGWDKWKDGKPYEEEKGIFEQ